MYMFVLSAKSYTNASDSCFFELNFSYYYEKKDSCYEYTISCRTILPKCYVREIFPRVLILDTDVKTSTFL